MELTGAEERICWETGRKRQKTESYHGKKADQFLSVVTASVREQQKRGQETHTGPAGRVQGGDYQRSRRGN